VEAEFTVGEIYISIMTELPSASMLPLGPPGRYRVRAEVVGRTPLGASRRSLPIGARPDSVAAIRVSRRGLAGLLA
jgi:hypothetical protein